MSSDERVEQARQIQRDAVFSADLAGFADAEQGLDEVEADVALTRATLLHTRFLVERKEDTRHLPLIERALDLYQTAGDRGGQAQALFWLGCFHQVVRADHATAVPFLARSEELAAELDDDATRSYALRHLGMAAHADGRLDEARADLEESLRLRRELGFADGAAANLVGLAYIAAAQGRRDDGLALLHEAETLATQSGADRVVRQVREARGSL